MTTEAKFLAADNDRDMLEYLHDAFSSQVNVCDNCGHETATSECDSASDLRDYLSHFPTPPQPIYDESKERELFEVYYRAEFEGNTGNELSDADIKSMRDGPWYGESRHYLNGQWAGWKACAQGRGKAGEVGHE